MLVALSGLALSVGRLLIDRHAAKISFARDVYRDQAWNTEAFRKALLIEARLTSDPARAASLRDFAVGMQGTVSLYQSYSSQAAEELATLESKGWYGRFRRVWEGALTVPEPKKDQPKPGSIEVPYHSQMPALPDLY